MPLRDVPIRYSLRILLLFLLLPDSLFVFCDSRVIELPWPSARMALDTENLAVLSKDGWKIALLDVKSGQVLREFRIQEAADDLRLRHPWLLTAHYVLNQVHLHEAATGKIIQTLQVEFGVPQDWDLTQDGRYLTVGRKNGEPVSRLALSSLGSSETPPWETNRDGLFLPEVKSSITLHPVGYSPPDPVDGLMFFSKAGKLFQCTLRDDGRQVLVHDAGYISEPFVVNQESAEVWFFNPERTRLICSSISKLRKPVVDKRALQLTGLATYGQTWRWPLPEDIRRDSVRPMAGSGNFTIEGQAVLLDFAPPELAGRIIRLEYTDALGKNCHIEIPVFLNLPYEERKGPDWLSALGYARYQHPIVVGENNEVTRSPNHSADVALGKKNLARLEGDKLVFYSLEPLKRIAFEPLEKSHNFRLIQRKREIWLISGYGLYRVDVDRACIQAPGGLSPVTIERGNRENPLYIINEITPLTPHHDIWLHPAYTFKSVNKNLAIFEVNDKLPPAMFSRFLGFPGQMLDKARDAKGNWELNLLNISNGQKIRSLVQANEPEIHAAWNKQYLISESAGGWKLYALSADHFKKKLLLSLPTIQTPPAASVAGDRLCLTTKDGSFFLDLVELFKKGV